MQSMFTFPPIRRSDLSLGAPPADNVPPPRKPLRMDYAPFEFRSPMLSAHPLLVTAGVGLFALLVRI
jgi:hypothetical protein